jgi:peptide/nickel transport system permease protein
VGDEQKEFMYRYLLRRLIQAIPTLIIVSILIFLVTRLIPGTIIDIIAGLDSKILTEEQIKALSKLYGLDQPLIKQYFVWLASIIHGNMGYSFRTGQAVVQEIAARLPCTLELTLLATLISIVLGIPLGLFAAVKHNSLIDLICTFFAICGISIPKVWLGVLIIFILSRFFGWLPPLGTFIPFHINPVGSLEQLVFPALVLAFDVAATIARLTRSSMLEILHQNYIITAFSKGLPASSIYFRHCLKNALIPIITALGIQVGYMLAGAIAVEQIFTLPGIGTLLLSAIARRDYPVIQGTILFIAFAFILVNLFVDVLYGIINPKIRLEV